jgi:hypothetical protein
MLLNWRFLQAVPTEVCLILSPRVPLAFRLVAVVQLGSGGAEHVSHFGERDVLGSVQLVVLAF